MKPKTKNKLIELIPLDTPKNILRNYCGLTFLIWSLGLMAFTLLVAYHLTGTLPYLCFFAGICLASFFDLYRPSNPFFISELWKDRKMELKELDQSTLRVLTFFKSREAKKIVLTISFVLILVVILAWYVSNFALPKPKLTPEQASLKSRLTGSFGFGFLFFFATFAFQGVILDRYTLKNWDRIQREYEPWPVDKPFNRPLRFWWTKVTG